MSKYPFSEGDLVFLKFSAQGKRKAEYKGIEDDNAGNDIHVFEVIPDSSTFKDGHKEPLYDEMVEKYVENGKISLVN